MFMRQPYDVITQAKQISYLRGEIKKNGPDRIVRSRSPNIVNLHNTVKLNSQL